MKQEVNGMRNVGREVIWRMYQSGVCVNALMDWLGVPEDELFLAIRIL
jgi:hypothetical protein